jgi:hypothetical protein
MEPTHFDHFARAISSSTSRRALLNRISAAGMLAALTHFGTRPASADARKKHKKHDKKKQPIPALNTYGCLDVGQACRGNHALCCSGICQGKKPKKGKPDRRTCAAHDAGSCTAGQDSCVQGLIPCGTTGLCVQTTGKGDFCGTIGICAVCQKDEDCVATKGPGAACVVCVAACANSTGGTACYAAAD